jgi:Glycosyl transferase family 2
MTNDITFAIAIPVGPGEQEVRNTLASLDIQAPPPNLAILDASGETIVTQTVEKYSHLIKYNRCGIDMGQSAAIIEGWQALDGNVFGWLNVDDYLLPGALARVADEFRAHPEVDVIYGQSIYLDDAGAITGFHPSIHTISPLIYRACIISQPSCFIRRHAIEAVGGLNPDLLFTMDWDLWQRLFDNGARFKMLDQVLSAVTISQDTKTGNLRLSRLQEIQALTARTGWYVSLKSLFGFTAYHFMTYVFSKNTKRLLKSIWPSHGNSVSGVSPDGIIRSSALMPMPVIEAKAVNTLNITLEDSHVETTELSLVDDTGHVAAQAVPADGMASLTVPEGRTQEDELLYLQIKTKAPVRFIKANWCA